MILLTVVALLFLPTQAEEKCVKFHEWDESTGKCEWSGPSDACIGLMDRHDRTWFMPLLNFPNMVYREVCLKNTGNDMDEMAVKVVVRKGCMFTGYAHPMTGNGWQEVKLGENLLYGIYDVPNWVNNRTVATDWNGGLTRASCYCDPTEATVSGHVPAPPPDKKCIEYHTFNETTQSCEWTRESKFCAEIITNDNRKQSLEMPKWPEKRKYDVNHWTTQNHLYFHIHVVSIIVRQHCFATAYWNDFHQWKTLSTSGYGHHQVASPFNGLSTGNAGTARFICECIR